MSRIRLAVMLALALVIAAGCSKDSDASRKVAENQMSKALSQTGEKVKVALPDKKSLDLTGLPESLRYPGAEPLGHITGADPATNSETFVMQTDASLIDVVTFYKTALADYTLMAHNESPQMVTLAYATRDGKLEVGLVVGSRNQTGKTSMNVTLTRK
jgi:hypothetical protein